MGESPERSNGYAKRYCWPASALTEKEMRLLYDERTRTRKAISVLIREAVVERYGKNGDQRCQTNVER